jgi:cytochrome b6-f complex iron-sulfur subunit
MANLEILRQEGCDPTQHVWSRRNFVGLAGWATVLGSLGIGTLAFGRFMYPRVLFEPRTVVKIGKPDEYIVNSISERWIKLYRFWLIRNPDGFVCLSAKCTHLGCTPRYLESENKFKCPCHGSGFRGLPYSSNNMLTGVNFEGPAPRPLERFYIARAEDGQIMVDFGKAFRKEREEWEKPGSYLKYSG